MCSLYTGMMPVKIKDFKGLTSSCYILDILNT